MKYIFLMVGFIIVTIDAKEYYHNIKDHQKLAFVHKAKDKIISTIQESVKFKDIYYNKGITGIQLVCGEYAKEKKANQYLQFIYVSPNFIFYEKETRNFDKIWDQLCKYDNQKTSVFSK